MPLIQGVIDSTHIFILKSCSYLEDYFYHVKTWGYFIVVQAIVNQKKNNMNVFINLLNIVNDFKSCGNLGYINMFHIVVLLMWKDVVEMATHLTF